MYLQNPDEEHTTDKYIYVFINKNARKVLNPDKI